MTNLPEFYAIVDAEMLAKSSIPLTRYASQLRESGLVLIQYRNKAGADHEVLRDAEVLSRVFEGSGATLVLNDRIELVMEAGFDGVHVGQGDTPVGDARIILGDGRVIGVSTHTEEQLWAAELTTADYVAIGPVFSTSTKADAERPVGLAGVRMARALTTKPLVAIGGITRENARSVIEAGADSVAVISGLLVAGESVEKVAREFLERLR